MKKLLGFIMQLGVFRPIRQSQIFQAIISFHAVYVMNYLMRFKVAAQMFFHHKTMFLNISVFITKGMLTIKNKNIPISFEFSTFPV